MQQLPTPDMTGISAGISAGKMLEALSALRQLADGDDGFFTAAARILGQAVNCEMVIVLSHTCTPGEALAIYGAEDRYSDFHPCVIAIAKGLTRDQGGPGGRETERRDIITIAGLGEMNALACPCHNVEGEVQGHLVILRSSPIAEGGFTETFSTLISQRIGSKISRQTDRANLESSENNFRHLIENMSAGFHIHDDQCPIFINRALSDMYGYADTKELMDIGDLSLLWSPKDATRIQGLAENCKRDGAAPHTYECEGFKKDGSQIWMRITSQTVQWQGRTLISGTIHDITEERRSEEAFLERNRWFRQVV